MQIYMTSTRTERSAWMSSVPAWLAPSARPLGPTLCISVRALLVRAASMFLALAPDPRLASFQSSLPLAPWFAQGRRSAQRLPRVQQQRGPADAPRCLPRLVCALRAPSERGAPRWRLSETTAPLGSHARRWVTETRLSTLATIFLPKARAMSGPRDQRGR